MHDIRICPTTNVLISDNLPVRKSYFDSSLIAKILRRFLRILLKRTSTEAHVYMRRHQDAKVKHFDVSNVMYHKFSYGAVSYTLNGENVKVMLELLFCIAYASRFISSCDSFSVSLSY